MIGQKELLNYITKQITTGTFPRFSIIVGERGSEKNQVALVIARELHATCINVPDCKVETIRQVIEDSYKVKTLTVYNIQDADTMSLQARNALLKVTEEPPNKSYFVMTLEDENNTLDTIRSRGTIYRMLPYAWQELAEYTQYKYSSSDEEINIVLELCNTPADVDLLVGYKPKDFYSFVEKVVDNIATASGSNVFKINQSIKFKDTDEKGYDLELFWRAFCLVCMRRRYFIGMKLTSKYLALLHSKSINRLMIFDNWILEIRGEWADGSC